MKRNLLNSAALVLLFTQRTLATHKAFAMLEHDEEEVPPYEVLTAGNLSAYEISSFYEVDELGKIIGQGAIAFTLYDIVYTDERLFCETADCCAARNYSYDPFYNHGENYFPPCQTDTLLDTLSDACQILPSNTSITTNMLVQNLSNTCDYYTLYNHSNLSSALVNCVQNTLLSRWPGYCEGQQIDLAIPGTALAIAGIAVLLVAVWSAKEKAMSEKKNIAMSALAMITTSVPESAAWFWTAMGFIYTIPKLLNEYSLNVFTPSLFPIAIYYYVGISIGLIPIRSALYSIQLA